MVVKFNSENPSPSHGSNILTCCLPLDTRGCVFLLVDGLRRGEGASPPCQDPQQAYLLHIPHFRLHSGGQRHTTAAWTSFLRARVGFAGRGGSHDKEAVGCPSNPVSHINPHVQRVTTSAAKWPCHPACLLPADSALLIADPRHSSC